MMKILLLFVVVTSSTSEVLRQRRQIQNTIPYKFRGFLYGRTKREAGIQNCFGSNCNQNNGVAFFPYQVPGFPFGRKKREANSMIPNKLRGVGYPPYQVPRFPYGRKKREAGTQNCYGSNCNQVNGFNYVNVGSSPFLFGLY